MISSMITRRNFIKTSALFTGGIALSGMGLASKIRINPLVFTSQRPEIEKRKFTSDAIEKLIMEVKASITDPELAWMFENCFPNTLDTTIQNIGILNGKQDAFVITGDIPAMWLRDSAAQVYPYIPYINEDDKLKNLIRGVINRHTRCVLIDPYANAFNYDNTVKSYWYSDHTAMKPELHERKWEVDSLCYVIRTAYRYWKISGDISLFDEEWQQAMRLIVVTFREQQRKTGKGPYTFQRETTCPSDSLTGNGYGAPVNPVGMICSMFRPSDDATVFPFLIPSNLFAAVSLTNLAEIMQSLNNQTFARECQVLSDEISIAVNKYAIVEHPDFGKVYAYEVDGFGSHYLMDDANMPNLLSLAYFDSVDTNDTICQNTRRMVLSDKNPYFNHGKFGEGNGSEHSRQGNVWHLSIITRALTSDNDSEILQCLQTLKATHAGTGFMHESFNINNPDDFTRKWFAWANTQFGELILKIYHERPYLLKT